MNRRNKNKVGNELELRVEISQKRFHQLELLIEL